MSNGDLQSLGTLAAAIVAFAALVLSIVNFVLAYEPRVRWSVESVLDKHNYLIRIRNESQRWVAHVTEIVDADTFETTSVRNRVALPADIEPGNWLPVTAIQYPTRPPIRVTIQWRQRKLGRRWTRPVTRTATLFIR